MSVGAVLLAAGGSARMGEPKQLLMIDGETLLRRMARVLVASIRAAARRGAGRTCRSVRESSKRDAHRDRDKSQWKEGLASSIRAAMRALDRAGPSLEAVVMAVCDQPLLTPGLIDLLISKWRATESRIVASEYNGVKGVPALFSRVALRSWRPCEGIAAPGRSLRRTGIIWRAFLFPAARTISIPRRIGRAFRARTDCVTCSPAQSAGPTSAALSATRIARATMSLPFFKPFDEALAEFP